MAVTDVSACGCTLRPFREAGWQGQAPASCAVREGTGTGCAGRLIPSASTGRGDRKAAASGAFKAAVSGVLVGCNCACSLTPSQAFLRVALSQFSPDSI